VIAYLAAFGLAIGLALDTAVVAAARSIAGRDGLGLPWLFGLAHGVMATIGWLLGRGASPSLSDWDHWVAFGLLIAVGTRMIVLAFRPLDAAPPAERGWELAAVVIATSLDALAAGFAIDALAIPPLVAIAMIAAVCVATSTVAVLVGRVAGRFAGRPLEAVGGIVLIAVAIRVVVLHTS
jgi:putative Mn2+ efflux pump MntP